MRNLMHKALMLVALLAQLGAPAIAAEIAPTAEMAAKAKLDEAAKAQLDEAAKAKQDEKPSLPNAEGAKPLVSADAQWVANAEAEPLALRPPTPKRENAMSLEVDRSTRLLLPQPAASVFVTNPAVADFHLAAPDTVIVYGISAGETSLIALDKDNRLITQRLLVVRRNMRELSELLKSFMPERDIAITPLPRGVVLDGELTHATEVDDVLRLVQNFMPTGSDVINRLRITGPTQVMLNVRVAEISRNVTKQLGINWNTAIDVGSATVSYALGDPVAAVSGISGAEEGGGSLFFGLAKNGLSINSLINALSAESLVSILAEPSMTAMSGETSSFLAGGEFPIPVPQGDGTISIEYKPFGVALAFTPTIVNGDRINLRVVPEVSELSFNNPVEINNNILPTLIKRTANTTVELGSGQSLIIGGLLQNTNTQNINKLPMLGDVPVLGALFRSTAFRRSESELVIIVTPYFVKPTSQKLATPLDKMHLTSDFTRLIMGTMVTAEPAELAESLPAAELAGPAGFEME